MRAHIDVSKLLIEGRNRVDIFMYRPDNVDREHLGNLFIVGEIETLGRRQKDDFFVLNSIASIIKKTYYNNASNTPEDNLELALKQVNNQITTFTNREFSAIRETFHFIIGVVAGRDLLFAKTGNSEVVLVRGTNWLNIGRAETEQKGRQRYKFFSDIISGRLNNRDSILFFTPRLTPFLSQESIRTKLASPNFDVEKAFIEKNLVTIDPATSQAFVQLQIHVNDDYATQSLKKTTLDKEYTDAPEVNIESEQIVGEDVVDEIPEPIVVPAKESPTTETSTHTDSDIESFMQDTTHAPRKDAQHIDKLAVIKNIGIKGIELVKKSKDPVKHALKTFAKRTDAFVDEHEKDIEKAKELSAEVGKKTLDEVKEGARIVGTKTGSILKKSLTVAQKRMESALTDEKSEPESKQPESYHQTPIGPPPSLIERIRAIVQIVSPAHLPQQSGGNKFFSWFSTASTKLKHLIPTSGVRMPKLRSHSSGKKRLYVLSGFFALTIIALVGSLIYQQRVLTQIEERAADTLETNALFTQLLTDNQTNTIRLTDEEIATRFTTLSLSRSLRIRAGFIRVNQTPRIVLVGDDSVYFADEVTDIDGTYIRYNADLTPATHAMLLDTSNQLVLYSADTPNKFAFVNLRTGEVLADAVDLNAPIEAVAGFNNRVYALTQDQIYRYDPFISNVTLVEAATGTPAVIQTTVSVINRTPWLNADESLFGPLSLAIDGSIHILDSNAMITSYSAGEKTSEIPVGNLFSVDQRNGRIAALEEKDMLAVLNPSESSILLYSTDGELVGQFINPLFESAVDAAYDARTNELLVYLDNQIAAVSLDLLE